MKSAVLLLVMVCLVVTGAAMWGQTPDLRLPNGKPWADEISRVEYESNLKDARELASLTAEIESELESADQHILPLKVLKKLERAESLMKDIKTRLRRN